MTLRPKRGAWIIEGRASPQTSKDGLESLPGGGCQGLIKSSDLPASSIIKTERVDFRMKKITEDELMLILDELISYCEEKIKNR